MIRLFLAFTVFFTAKAATWGTPSPAGWPGTALPVVLAENAAIPAEVGVGVIAFVVGIIGYHFVIGKYIRQQAGVKDSQPIEVSGQPIEVKAQVQFVQREEMQRTLGGYVTSKELHQVESRIDEKMEANFRSLDNKRSASIGNLHEHLTGATAALTNKIAEAGEVKTGEIMKVHTRVDELAKVVGASSGKLEILSKQLENLTNILMEKAVGGKKG